ncbi:hypothetical protein O3620_07085 [Streptococcus sp. 27098_8_134]|jgi:hypothetical protein|uniref:YjbE family integral membrane protein n=1 Tax=Streptococcus sanguinis SK1087 TaxID=888824 RepID=F3SHC6_STRSA|nr:MULTISPECIES: DUF6574 domain-containing protein [Streptococcus]EGG40509.1 hypothetical protein HMPREF9397_0548 [Streptococcus sanguinis SK1087]MDN5011186.1 hypothetical protein [Streptococcus sp. SN3]
MSKEDWLEYFEAVNGRSATEEEIAQALAAGEFVEAEQVSAEQAPSDASPASSSFEQPQQEAQTVETQGQPQNFAQPQNFQQPFAQQYQEAPQQQANQAYQQPGFQQASPFAGQPQSSGPQAYQNNPQQGQFNSQVPQQGPQAYYSQQPPQPSEFSKTMKGFWAWLVSAWKSPTSEVESSKVNGYLSLGLTAFFFAIVANYNIFSTIGIMSFGMYNGPTFNFKVFFVSLIAAALFLFSIILGGFVVKRLVYQDRSFTFNKAFDWYGRLYAIVLPFIAVSALFALLGIIHLSLFFTWIGLLLVGVGATFALIYSKTNNSMDPFYKYLLAIIVNGVITLFFSFIAFSLLTSIAMM